MTDQGEDPGWTPAIRMVLLVLVIPFAATWIMRRREKGSNSLVALRQVSLGFVLMLLLLGSVLLFLAGSLKEARVSPVVIGALLVLTVYSVAAAAWFQRRPLLTTSAAALADSYRAATFIGLAMSQGAGPIGFVVSFKVGRPWPYAIGLVAALGGHLLVAPSASNLRRRQERITGSGSPLSLLDALVQPASRTPPRPDLTT